MHFGGFFCQFRRVRFHLSLEVKYIGPRSENPTGFVVCFCFWFGGDMRHGNGNVVVSLPLMSKIIFI